MGRNRSERRLTPQEEEDRDTAYSISDKRTTNLADALRMVEEERTTATVDQKLSALHEAIRAIAERIGGMDTAMHDLDLVMDKETRDA